MQQQQIYNIKSYTQKHLITHPSDVAGWANDGVSTNNVFSFGRFRSRRMSCTTIKTISNTKK